MKVENTSHSDAVGRKAPLWTRERISQLIELYKKHECLWNHWHDSYKCKVKRNRAIEDICFALRITKFDFGRKIHNLRNQFNTEMKKLEQRVEESGESVDVGSTSALRCKWTHFESLMFLRNVIEPRPGGYQSSFQAPKKMRLRFDYNSAEDDVNVTMLPSNIDSNCASAQHNDDATQFEQYEEDEVDDVPTEEYNSFEMSDDQKYQPLPAPIEQNHASEVITQIPTVLAANTRALMLPTNNQKTVQTPQSYGATSLAAPLTRTSRKVLPHTEVVNIGNEDSAVIEVNANNVTVISSSTAPSSSSMPASVTTNSSIGVSAASNSTPCVSTLDTSSMSTSANALIKTSTTLPLIRDQWDAFGELVATELRNLNSDMSRKKLKRKIMQAMLQVGEEDDAL